MKTLIEKLVQLADRLDYLGLKKDADVLDKIISKTAAGEDFEDYLKMFDEPVGFEDETEKGPVEERVVLDEPEVHTPLDEEEAPLAHSAPGFIPSRRDMLKRRHELMKLKKQFEKAEKEENREIDKEIIHPEVEEIELPIAVPEDLKTFEDEDEDEDMAVNSAADEFVPNLDAPEFDDLEPELKKQWEELQAARMANQDEAELDEMLTNDADDGGGLIDKLKEVLKGAPQLAMQLFQLVKDNPELLELLAL